MAGVTLFGFTILRSQTESEIRKLFEVYATTLSAQKLKMTDDITQWGDALMLAIYKHVKNQKYLLEQEYGKQIEYLNTTCQQFFEGLRVHEQMKNTEQIDQLLDQCKTLKFELAALEHHGKIIPFIEVPIKEAHVMNQDEFDAVETENEKFYDASTVKADNINLDSFTIKTSTDDNQSTIHQNDILEECSTCLMVFSSSMAPDDRIAHINGHLKKD